MSDQPTYYVFTNAAHELKPLADARRATDEWWRQHGPIPAANGDAAIAQLRDASPELKADKSAVFIAIPVSRFKRRRMRRQLVTRWALDDADVPDDPVPGEDDAQGRLT